MHQLSSCLKSPMLLFPCHREFPESPGTHRVRSTGNNSGRLAQVLKCGIKGTNTIIFILMFGVPAGRKAIYGACVVVMIFIERDLIPKEDKGAYNHV
jgi:hypothetical protein